MANNDDEYNNLYGQQPSNFPFYSNLSPYSTSRTLNSIPQKQLFSSSPTGGSAFSQFSSSPIGGYDQFSSLGSAFQQFSTPSGGYQSYSTPLGAYHNQFKDFNLNDDDDEEDVQEEQDEQSSLPSTPSPPRTKGKAKGKGKTKEKAKGKGKATEPEDDSDTGGRGNNYTPDDIAWIAQCYVDYGLNTINSNYQKLHQFWGKIHDRFNEYSHPTKPRKVEAIRSAWTRAKRDIQKFHSCYVKFQWENGNGRSDYDLYKLAEDSYELTHEKFKHRKACEIVKDLPNFLNPDTLTQPTKRTKSGADGSYTSNSSNPSNSKSVNETSSMRSRPLRQKSGKMKAATAAVTINTVREEMSMPRQQIDGIDFKTAYEIYTGETNGMSSAVLEKYLEVCAILKKKFNFDF